MITAVALDSRETKGFLGNTIVMMGLGDEMIQNDGRESLLLLDFLKKYVCFLPFHIVARDL